MNSDKRKLYGSITAKKLTVNKYHNKKTTLYGITFDSKAEAKFYLYLRSQFKKEDIILQPEFILQEKFKDESGKTVRQIKYIADFYVKSIDIYFDVKGVITNIFALKFKMMKQKYPYIYLMYGDNKFLIMQLEQLIYGD